MSTHRNLLNLLVDYSSPASDLANKISALNWDYDGPRALLNAGHLITVIDRYLAQDITAQDIEDWAKLIECREDLEYASELKYEIEEVINKLSNPVLEGKITPTSCKKMLYVLRNIE